MQATNSEQDDGSGSLDSVELPTVSVDPDDDLADRLTTNVQENIGPSRYFRKDSDGEPIEDWDDVFERVASNIALAEAVFHDMPLHVGRDVLADWVTAAEVSHLFSFSEETIVDDKGRAALTEELAPYCDYDAVRDRAPDEIAEAMETTKDRFEQAMREQRFVPNSPTLMNAGTELQMLSACFVVEPGDAMTGHAPDGRASIMRAAEDAADIFRGGGGVGYPFHLLRPKGARIDSTNGVSSGPMSFMQIFDAVCGSVKQGGRRRGAQMGIMHCQHPDVGRFCLAKRGEDNLTNFNISVGVTDEFRQAVEHDEEYTLYDPESGWGDPAPFEVVPETAHFYDPQFEDAWNDQYDKPAEGYDGKSVEENFWRDYLDDMTDPDAFEQYRDRIDLEPGDPLTLPAGFVYQLLVDGAHNKGEPGIIYLDEANREHSFDVDEHPSKLLHSTNPCVTGETLISTASGLQRADDLADGDADTCTITVDSRLSDDPTKTATPVYQTGEKDVYTLTTHEGYELRLTADHRVMTDNGWVEAQNLESGDTVHIQDRKGQFGQLGSASEGRVLGWLVGDGHLKDEQGVAVLNVYDDKTSVSETLVSDVNEIIRAPEPDRSYDVGINEVSRSNDYRGQDAVEQRICSARLYELVDDVGLTDTKTQVPDRVMRGTEAMAREFCRALFGADGSVQGSVEKGYSVRLSTADVTLAQDVQTLLANFGIFSTVYENRKEPGKRRLPDGSGGYDTYETQGFHELVISAGNLQTFVEEIGFLDDRKQAQLESALDEYTRGPYAPQFTAIVESVEYDGHEPVYDLTEPETNSFIANGIVVHNCGEQILENYEPCNLGHVNLALLADDNARHYDEWLGDNLPDFDVYVDDGHIRDYLDHALDTEQLAYTVETGTRFLDNVVTMSDFPLEDIEERAHEQRKIGLGLMGFHELLLQLGIEYGSDASYAVARELMRRIDDHATTTSHELAVERDPFPAWEQSKWAQPAVYPDWFKTHAHRDPAVFDDGLPVRNHNVSTIAPTGSTSMIGNTTGGCEPLYNVAYYKNVADDVQGEEMLVEIDDYFLRVLETNGIDTDEVRAEIEETMDAGEFDGVDDLETVPDSIGDLFITTDDLSVEQHIRVQAAFQEYCDSSISKTLNIANDATLEDTADAIELALDLGIKGATIYRIGSRATEVKTTNTTGGGIPVTEADDETLIDELVDRVEADETTLRQTVMAELGLANTTVEPIERDRDKLPEPDPFLDDGHARQDTETDTDATTEVSD